MNIDLDKLVEKRIEEYKNRLAEIALRNQRHEVSRQERFEEFVNGENSFKKRAAKLLDIINGEYSPVRLHKLFRLDNWTNQQGLIILAGLHPAHVEFTKEGSLLLPTSLGDDLAVMVRESSDLRWVRTLDNVRLFSSETVEILGEEAVKNLSWDFKHRHAELLEIWESGNHTEHRYPPKYFIDWALSKEFDIDWLKWAGANGYYGQGVPLVTMADDLSRAVAPNSASAYLHIIGALTELYWKAAHGDEKYSQAAVLDELRKYRGFHGMGERNLKEKLTMAIQALKQVD